ncbi:MAG: ABC transporter permease [Candidatus Bathyarchaeota archaeon]
MALLESSKKTTLKAGRKALALGRVFSIRFEDFSFLIPLSLMLLFWESLLRLNVVSSEVLPAPSQILLALLLNLLTKPEFTASVFISLLTIGLGLVIAILVTLPLAIVTGLKARIDVSITPLIMVVGALPDVALMPFFIYWFGKGMETALLIAVMVAFFPLFFTLREGVKHIPSDYFHAAMVFNAEGLKFFTKLVFPAILPQFITGVRLAYEFLWEVILAVEVIARINGVGFLITLAVGEGSLTQAFAGIFMIGVIVILVDRLIFQVMESRVKRWHE